MNAQSFSGYDHMRWCAVCGTQRGTQRGRFGQHTKPNGKPCPNSGQRVDEVEEAGHNKQTKIGAL